MQRSDLDTHTHIQIWVRNANQTQFNMSLVSCVGRFSPLIMHHTSNILPTKCYFLPHFRFSMKSGSSVHYFATLCLIKLKWNGSAHHKQWICSNNNNENRLIYDDCWPATKYALRNWFVSTFINVSRRRKWNRTKPKKKNWMENWLRLNK